MKVAVIPARGDKPYNREAISLLMLQGLTDEQQDRIISVLSKILTEAVT